MKRLLGLLVILNLSAYSTSQSHIDKTESPINRAMEAEKQRSKEFKHNKIQTKKHASSKPEKIL